MRGDEWSCIFCAEANRSIETASANIAQKNLEPARSRPRQRWAMAISLLLDRQDLQKGLILRREYI
jgi:hypothetical protein